MVNACEVSTAVRLRIESEITFLAASIPSALRDEIIRDLTLQNPAHASALRAGRSTYNIPQHLTIWQITNGVLTLPRGYSSALLRRLHAHGVTWEMDDQRLTLPTVGFSSRIQLRSEQVPAVGELVRIGQGGLVAPCGSGKTTMGLEAIASIGQPALVIVHTQELVDQWMERAKDFLGISHDEIGVVGGGKRIIGPRLTIGLVQTLSKMDLTKIQDRFGLVLLDEAHHAPATTFRQVLGSFPAHYRFWLSATPERSDGLHPVLYAVGGPVLHRIDRTNLRTITPTLRIVETEFDGVHDDYSTLLTQLTQDEPRNRLIVDTVAANALDHYSLVLSERVEHLDVLRAMLAQAVPFLRTAILTGRMNKQDRREVMARVQAREIDVLFATQLAREGLDIVHLDQLFMTCPKRAAAAVEQECGRVMRPAEGKTGAAVWDFWDSGNPMLRGQFWRRRDVYRRLGMAVDQ